MCSASVCWRAAPGDIRRKGDKRRGLAGGDVTTGSNLRLLWCIPALTGMSNRERGVFIGYEA